MHALVRIIQKNKTTSEGEQECVGRGEWDGESVLGETGIFAYLKEWGDQQVGSREELSSKSARGNHNLNLFFS